MNKFVFDKLASNVANPSVTISLNTHRTHPDNQQDIILLKNLTKEVVEKLKSVDGGTKLIDKLNSLADSIDVNQNLDSLHLFVSDTIEEVIRSPLKVTNNNTSVANRFSLKPIIKLLNRTELYYIMVLSQSGVKLYEATNDAVISEVRNSAFPFPETPFFLENNTQKSDGKRADNQVREYLNQVDKALVDLCNTSDKECVVICTEDNYSRLMQVADKPQIYIGYAAINYNDTAPHNVAKQAWQLVKAQIDKSRADAVEEVGKAVGNGLVYTDLAHIFRAASEGRGDLFICNSTYRQDAKITGDATIEILNDQDQNESHDDIVSEIALRVIERKGRVVFIDSDMVNGLGDVALKLTY
jgi:hypothetical protein